jgi:hypothetical protein
VVGDLVTGELEIYGDAVGDLVIDGGQGCGSRAGKLSARPFEFTRGCRFVIGHVFGAANL